MPSTPPPAFTFAPMPARTAGDFADFVDAAFAGGVDIIQLRDKSLEAAEELELLESCTRRPAAMTGSGPSTTGRTSRRSSGAPVFHIGQKDIPARRRQEVPGPGHRDRVVHPQPGAGGRRHRRVPAGRDGLDYFCVGPVWATPTKPGRAAVGLDLVRYAADAVRQAEAPEGTIATAAGTVPWFAIGGIDLGNVEQVVEAGARRIVVVRAITEADDPAGAARALLAALDAAGN